MSKKPTPFKDQLDELIKKVVDAEREIETWLSINAPALEAELALLEIEDEPKREVLLD